MVLAFCGAGAVADGQKKLLRWPSLGSGINANGSMINFSFCDLIK
jgi:hypothetical protein